MEFKLKVTASIIVEPGLKVTVCTVESGLKVTESTLGTELK